MKYWKKLHRESNGHYYAENDFNNQVLHIYRIDKNLWGYCYDRGMTKGMFPTLKDAKNYFGL